LNAPDLGIAASGTSKSSPLSWASDVRSPKERKLGFASGDSLILMLMDQWKLIMQQKKRQKLYY